MHLSENIQFDRRVRNHSCALSAALILRFFTVPNASADDVLWTSHVEPMLKEHCAECHNPTKAKSGLDVSSLQTLLRGGDRGAAVIPGRANDSNLYKFLSSDSDPHMPPAKHKPLGEEDIGLIKKWIEDLPVVASGTSGTSTNWSATNYLAALAKPRIPWKPPTNMPPSRVVDHFLELAWKLDQVKPAKPADDAAFVRRVYLDLAGRIPSAQEAADFIKSGAKDKRARLIDRLLGSDDYPRQLREVFDTVLMGRRGAEWEDQRANQKWFAFLEDAFRRNRPWNEVVRDVILARPDRPEDRGAVWYLYERQNNPQAIAEALAPVVFGVQVKCAQCHDHMVAREIKQAHYWGMVAAFNRSKNVDTPSGPGIAESAIGGFVSFANLKKESQPASLTFFNGRKVDEARPKEGEKETDSPELYLVPPPKDVEQKKGGSPKRRNGPAPKAEQPAVPKFSRRQAFADAVTRDNPLLARAMVNRLWAMLFGRGLVHPVELMDSKHPPSHPELLDWLARDFEHSGYDVKRLIRTICNSRAYQLSGAGVPPAIKSHSPKAPPPDSFARALDKPLSAEQLFRSLLSATGNQPDAEGKIAGNSERELRRAFVTQFSDLFPAEYNATLYQAMFLANSPLFDQLLAPREGNISARLLALRDGEMGKSYGTLTKTGYKDTPSPALSQRMEGGELQVREAFSVVFGREPDREELQECAGYLSTRSPEAGVKQLLWAMLTSAEFQLNH